MDKENEINHNLNTFSLNPGEQNFEQGPKKRSKSENEGRTFECKICNKSYLSYPALYTHCKKKNHINNSSGRGRGRPKKEGLEMETEKKKYNPINHTYFFKEERNGKTEISEIEKCIKTAFNELYFKNITIEMNLDI